MGSRCPAEACHGATERQHGRSTRVLPGFVRGNYHHYRYTIALLRTEATEAEPRVYSDRSHLSVHTVHGGSQAEG